MLLASGMRNMSKVRTASKVAVAAAVGAALLAGGCAPAARPYGYVGGSVLAAAGLAMATSAASADCTPEEPDPFGVSAVAVGACAGASAAGAVFGTVIAVTGAAILIAALASSSEHEPTPGALTQTPAPRPPVPPAPPHRSSSAPSGSPLAPAQSGALSMRAGSSLAFP